MLRMTSEGAPYAHLLHPRFWLLLFATHTRSLLICIVMVAERTVENLANNDSMVDTKEVNGDPVEENYGQHACTVTVSPRGLLTSRRFGGRFFYWYRRGRGGLNRGGKN